MCVCRTDRVTKSKLVVVSAKEQKLENSWGKNNSRIYIDDERVSNTSALRGNSFHGEEKTPRRTKDLRKKKIRHSPGWEGARDTRHDTHITNCSFILLQGFQKSPRAAERWCMRRIPNHHPAFAHHAVACGWIYTMFRWFIHGFCGDTLWNRW